MTRELPGLHLDKARSVTMSYNWVLTRSPQRRRPFSVIPAQDNSSGLAPELENVECQFPYRCHRDRAHPWMDPWPHAGYKWFKRLFNRPESEKLLALLQLSVGKAGPQAIPVTNACRHRQRLWAPPSRPTGINGSVC